MAPVLTVAAYTPGRTVPSARFRVRQYIPLLRERGILLTEFPVRGQTRSLSVRPLRRLRTALTLALRTPAFLASYRADVTLLQRFFIADRWTLEGVTHRPRVLDVDDAIFLANARATERLARACESVICGNDFLAEHFAAWNSNLCVIPTGVDVTRFAPEDGAPAPDSLAFTIGWTGSASNLGYLQAIEPALATVLRNLPEARLLISSERAPSLRQIDPTRVEFVAWSEANEVATIRRMDVGLMPLEDSAWARGKCSYKMLLYMACGVPVVVSPVGMNAEVLRLGRVGFGATTASEWVSALVELARARDSARAMGAEGRRVVVQRFSLKQTGAALAAHLSQYRR